MTESQTPTLMTFQLSDLHGSGLQKSAERLLDGYEPQMLAEAVSRAMSADQGAQNLRWLRQEASSGALHLLGGSSLALMGWAVLHPGYSGADNLAWTGLAGMTIAWNLLPTAPERLKQLRLRGPNKVLPANILALNIESAATEQPVHELIHEAMLAGARQSLVTARDNTLQRHIEQGVNNFTAPDTVQVHPVYARDAISRDIGVLLHKENLGDPRVRIRLQHYFARHYRAG